MSLRSAFLIFFLFIASFGSSQDTVQSKEDPKGSDTLAQDVILRMNGREIEGRILEVGMGSVRYQTFENGDTLEHSIPIAEVFSVDRAGQEEEVLYEKDSTRGNTLAEKDMRYFIRGEQDAMRGFKSPWTTVSGLALGAAGGYFLEFSVFTITVPLVFTLGSTVPKIHIDKATVSDPAYLEQDFYLKGYEKNARDQRLLNALKSSTGGVILGMALYAILNPEQFR